MDFTKWMAGGALIGFVTMAWSHIKAFVQRFNNHFIQHVTIMDHVHEEVVVAWLRQNCRLSPAYEKRYELLLAWVNERWETVPCESFAGRSVVFWYGWVPLYVTMPGKEQLQTRGNNSEPPSTNESRYLELYCLRGTFDVERMILEAAELKNQMLLANREQQVPRHRVVEIPGSARPTHAVTSSDSSDNWYTKHLVRLLQHEPTQLGYVGKKKRNALESLIFPEHVRALIDEIKRWAASAKWYEEKGLVWKHGWLMYGPAGTGKTALASAFAHDLNMPLWVFQLTRLSNDSFLKAWHSMTNEAPCIVLFEDFDNVFHGRKYVGPQPSYSSMMYGPARRKKRNDPFAGNYQSAPSIQDDEDDDDFTDDRALSFDTLLNCIDGAKRTDGVFLIITTNDITKIDPALGSLSSNGTLGTRPGRIDRVIELTYMEPDCMREMARRLLAEYPDLLESALQWISDNPDVKLTPAQWQNVCGQKALARYWHADRDEELQAAGRFWEHSYDKVDAELEGGDVTMASSAR